jgi:hypothetical protein
MYNRRIYRGAARPTTARPNVRAAYVDRCFFQLYTSPSVVDFLTEIKGPEIGKHFCPINIEYAQISRESVDLGL